MARTLSGIRRKAIPDENTIVIKVADQQSAAVHHARIAWPLTPDKTTFACNCRGG